MIGSAVPTLVVNHDTLTQILLVSSVINNVAVSIPLILALNSRLRKKILKELLDLKDAKK